MNNRQLTLCGKPLLYDAREKNVAQLPGVAQSDLFHREGRPAIGRRRDEENQKRQELRSARPTRQEGHNNTAGTGLHYDLWARTKQQPLAALRHFGFVALPRLVPEICRREEKGKETHANDSEQAIAAVAIS